MTALIALSTLAALGVWLFKRWGTHRNSWVEQLFGIPNIPVTHSLVSVSALGLLTLALIGRKQVGLLAVVAAQLVGMYAAVASLAHWAPHAETPSWATHAGYSHPLDVLSLVAGALMLGWCWYLRKAFPARLSPGSWQRAIAVLVSGLLLTIAVTWVLLSLQVPGPGLARWQHVGAALARSLGDADLVHGFNLERVPAWIPECTSILLSLTLLGAVVVFLRSARHRNAWTSERELTLRRLLLAGAPDSLGYFATRRDKSSILSARGDAALTYRVLNGVSLASGDPIGESQHWSEVIAAWKAEARRFGWVPAVLSASEQGARAYAAAGLSPISMGDEALLDPDHFSLDQPSMTPVRHAVKRARRAGLRVTFRRQDEIGVEELAELSALAEAWRGDEPERGFSMALNRLGDPADFDVLVATARDGGDRLMAVLTFVPWGAAGASLDLMRRCPQAPNGVVELIVAELMRAAPTLGVRRVSLNFCMFRSVYADAARLGAGTLTRINYTLLGSLDRIWQLERLYRSNQKYQPEWRPRYLCYDGRLALPLVGIAAGVAEGFLPRGLFPAGVPEQSLSEDDLLQVRALVTDAARPPSPRRGDQERVRLAHVELLRGLGRDPYPVAGDAGTGRPTHTLAQLTGLAQATGSDPGEVRVSARVLAVRDHGGLVFADLTEDGVVWQALVAEDTVAQQREFARLVDVGDLVLVTGVLGRSLTGEPSLVVSDWQVVAKSLHPVPFGALQDPAARVRQRATDLIVHPDQARFLRQRAAVVTSLRRALQDEGFLEVETPILNTVHGGASARPFRTFSNAYGLDLSLRIAPELQLKRLVVGGIGPVFEIGRNFRNEGVDATHNPEFTSLEAYRPYADYTDMRHLAERLVRGAAVAVHGAEVLPLVVDGVRRLVDVSGPWPVVPVLEAVSAAVGVEVSLEMDFDHALGLARAHGVATRGDMGVGALLEGLYGELVEPATVSPTFFVDFPRETSPLTRGHRSKPGLVERWDLVIDGTELGTAYSELTDPVDQRQRFTDQSLKAAAGDLEAMELDEAFLGDLELGMPPTGGLGLGVDRLAMAVLGVPIRSVLAFPFVKPRRLE